MKENDQEREGGRRTCVHVPAPPPIAPCDRSLRRNQEEIRQLVEEQSQLQRAQERAEKERAVVQELHEREDAKVRQLRENRRP